LEHSRWDKVTTVGDDQLLFLGRRCSRAVSVSQYDIPGDSILYSCSWMMMRRIVRSMPMGTRTLLSAPIT
jgi:hypothetical protein